MKNNAARGFTLLELSVVLVIIGVLLGGVVVGRSLLVTARIRTAITDADSYITAVGNFKQTYQSLPGDMPNATAQWGTDNNTCTTGGGSSGTCNGNGDGKILNSGSASQPGETFLFWQHLYKAGMLTKSLSNAAGANGAYDSSPGLNVPEGSIQGSGFSAVWWGTLSGDANRYDGEYGNILQLGKAISGTDTRGPALTPDQMASIDAKIDDGFPATGKVRGYIYNSVNPGCTTSASTPLYNVSNPAILCPVIFVTGF